MSPDLARFPTPLIRATELAAWLPQVVLLDARFDLARPDAGAAAFAQGHIPGARHLHLDHDLSAGPASTGAASALSGGRHPLPGAAQAAATFGRFGVQPGVPVVICDEQGGMLAARAWWLLRWLGHGPVAVLDGGLRAWRDAGGAIEAGASAPVDSAAPAYPLPATPGLRWVDAATVARGLGRQVLIDARAPERFRGEVEPLDPVAGHIPGALNRPFAANLGADGCFLAPATLRAAFTDLIGHQPLESVVHQCGSGVTACHNLLAMEVAGLRGASLYAGSWSEWCSDPSRPVARG